MDGRAIVVRHVKACQEDILELVKILKKAVAGGGVMAEPTKEEEEGQPWMICEARDLGSNVESGCVAVGGPGGGKKELLACGKVSFVPFRFRRVLLRLVGLDLDLDLEARRFELTRLLSFVLHLAVPVESILLCW